MSSIIIVSKFDYHQYSIMIIVCINNAAVVVGEQVAAAASPVARRGRRVAAAAFQKRLKIIFGPIDESQIDSRLQKRLFLWKKITTPDF